MTASPSARRPIVTAFQDCTIDRATTAGRTSPNAITYNHRTILINIFFRFIFWPGKIVVRKNTRVIVDKVRRRLVYLGEVE